MRIIHWRMLRLNTGKLPRSLRPSAVTSSLATTVPRPGHQLTGASDDVGQAVAVDDVGLLATADSATTRRPSSSVARAGVELGAQLGDRAGPADAAVGSVGVGVVPGRRRSGVKIHCVQR